MCGVCGLVALDGRKPSESTALRMRDAMYHRGPDGKGIVAAPGVVFAHRRLSIIDVAGSPQPMADPVTGSFVTYNGEIYNYAALRAELETSGEVFVTRGDTEVLLKILDREGVNGLRRLNGIFAFAFRDGRTGRVILGRDRLGVKPLYYWSDGSTLAFASETKAFLEVPEFTACIDRETMPSFLLYANVHGERTLLDRVRKVPPGACGVIERGRMTIERYWSIPEPDYESDVRGERATSMLRELLQDSVRLQMVSDVPVGSLCSGGLDSSLISAMCVERSGHAFNTFNATFPQGPPFDESSFAREVSHHIGSDHHEILVTADDVACGLVPLIWHNDEPIHHTSSIPIYYVTRRAARYVTVLLAGEGADELFAGYPRYRILRWATRGASPTTGAALRMAARLVPNRRRREKLIEHLSMSVDEAVLFNVMTVRHARLRQVLRPEWRIAIDEAPLEFERSIWGTGPRDYESLVRRLLRFEQATYLCTSLDRLDKMAMAASVEGRVPFLDHRIVEFAAAVRLDAMLRGSSGKALLKDAAGRWLPRRIIHRRKWGFGLPVASVLRSRALSPWIDLLWQPDARAATVFDVVALRGLWNDVLAGRDELGDLLWRALNLEIWMRLFVDRSMPPVAAPTELGAHEASIPIPKSVVRNA